MLEQDLIEQNILTGKSVNEYQIVKFLKSGSFGDVYLAEKNGKHYAIKLFKESYVLAEYRRNGENNRIKREIDIIKSIKSDYLISYEDDFIYNHQDTNHYCLVMEYFDGITLRDLLNQKKIMDETEVLGIFSKILLGISDLHNFNTKNLQQQDDYGIIHRDLKPENIMIDANGNIRILDFGVSKIIDYTSITATGTIMGTWAYMSPEQIGDSKHISKRSDLYSLGVILYELLTGVLPYKETNSLPELINYIVNEKPIAPRMRSLSIPNSTENIILKLIEKLPYKRFQSIENLIDSLDQNLIISTNKTYDLTPRFILRLWQEKTALEKFIGEGNSNKYVEFPANLQYTQPGLLKLIQTFGTAKQGLFKLKSSESFIKLVDPATARLAYAGYQDNKGLTQLPYAPDDMNIITPNFLNSYKKQQKYVKQVIDEQHKLGADILLSPFHYVNNTSIIPTVARNPIAEWLDLDIKLLRESIDYKNNSEELKNKEIYAGICLHAESLLDESHRNYILNTFSGINCDGYLIYADCIDNNTNQETLYHFIKTLQTLQKNTLKPVIAGRVNPIGLGLICAGITGFTSGAAQFDSFSEDLYKDTSSGFNLYERYFFPQLLSTIGIRRKEPTKLTAITNALGSCDCPYCKNKEITKIIQSSSNKLHFLYNINREVEIIKEIPPEERIEYFINRIDIAYANYQKTEGIFLPKEYSFLRRWKMVFEKLNEDQKK